jgi:pimeloyl-ACP methyl ester carboxylesterase
MATLGVAVCTYDSHGCGESYLPNSGSVFALTTETMADDALGLMEELNWEKCHVFSWSMGGMVACKMAAMAPHRIQSATLVGVTKSGLDIFYALCLAVVNTSTYFIGALWRRARVWSALQRFFTPEWLNHRVYSEALGYTITRQELMIRHSMEKNRVNLVMAGDISNRAALSQEFATIRHRLRKDEIQRIKASGIPITFINGARDFTTRLSPALKLSKELDALMIVPNARHAGLMVEKAELVAWVLENSVLGGQKSTQQQREATRRRAEDAMLQTSFYF